MQSSSQYKENKTFMKFNIQAFVFFQLNWSLVRNDAFATRWNHMESISMVQYAPGKQRNQERTEITQSPSKAVTRCRHDHRVN